MQWHPAGLEDWVMRLDEAVRRAESRLSSLDNAQWQSWGGGFGGPMGSLEVRYAKTTGGAMSGGSVSVGGALYSGTVTFYAMGGATKALGSDTATAYSMGPVSANTDILVIGKDGDRWDTVVVLCP